MIFTEPLHEVVVAGYDVTLTQARVNWCGENLGPYGSVWRYDWNNGGPIDFPQGSTWQFVNEEDAIMFALRWT